MEIFYPISSFAHVFHFVEQNALKKNFFQSCSLLVKSWWKKKIDKKLQNFRDKATFCFNFALPIIYFSHFSTAGFSFVNIWTQIKCITKKFSFEKKAYCI